MELFSLVERLISTIGPLGVFWASVLEEIIVIIPSSAIQLGAGFFILGGDTVNFISLVKLITYISIPAAIGVSIGSVPIYLISYYGGERGIKKFGKWFMLSWDQILNLKNKLDKRKTTNWLFIFFRFLPIVPNVVVTAFSGLIQIPIQRYLFLTFSGIFIRTTIMASIGWMVGDFYKKISVSLDFVEKTIGVILVLAVFLWVRASFLKNKNSRKTGLPRNQ